MDGKVVKQQEKCEWLKLRVGRKMFSCKFCSREFSTPQALGGHQNAHKREKSMLQHCMAAAAALGSDPHSYVPDKHIDGATAQPALTRPAFPALEEELPWLGCSRQEELPQDSPYPDVLDLDLKL